MVLAISSALAIGLLSSFGNSQRRTRFSDAIERVVSSLESIRTEVNSAYTTSTTGGADTLGERIFFAKSVQFDNNLSVYTISTLTAKRIADDSLDFILLEGTPVTASIPWGVYCACPGADRVVSFVRHPASGQLNVYVMNTVSNNPIDYAISSNPDDPDAGVTNLVFKSPDNLCAAVIINAATGEISRSFDYNNNVC